jgi:hypothetical protein
MTTARRPRNPVLVLLLAALASCTGTKEWRLESPPWTQASVAGALQVRVTTREGLSAVVEEATIGRDAKGDFLAGRVLEPVEKTIRIELLQIQSIERNDYAPEDPSTELTALFLVAAFIVITGTYW